MKVGDLVKLKTLFVRLQAGKTAKQVPTHGIILQVEGTNAKVLWSGGKVSVESSRMLQVISVPGNK
jgi:hypothetical protein|tara:strand:- start:105 stop:302 length:198 start_codon:yes stop_codon:yes gene_type:complete